MYNNPEPTTTNRDNSDTSLETRLTCPMATRAVVPCGLPYAWRIPVCRENRKEIKNTTAANGSYKRRASEAQLAKARETGG